MRIAVVGGGVSGVAAARVLQACGHTVVVFERGATPGGVWTRTYPGVRLQNVAEHYRLADYPWPFTPDLHPTSEQILRYVAAAVAHYRIDLRPGHAVTAMHAEPDGWTIDLAGPAGPLRERFDFAVVASGHYSGEQVRHEVPGRERFAGEVKTEREIGDLAALAGRRVVIFGMGKTAVDLASFAAERGSQVTHVFRAPRWLLPTHILGVHMKDVLFARMSTAFIPAWVQPSASGRALHGPLQPLVRGFWRMITGLTRAVFGLHPLWRDPAIRRRMRALLPDEPLTVHMRAASAIAPAGYFPGVIAGRIEPIRGELAEYTADGVRLRDGQTLACDLVLTSFGNPPPSFPFLPAEHRALLEGEADGVQLYRHLLHPRIPRLAFAGFNHGFLHVPTVEVATLWLAAHLRGDLELPPVAEMERCVAEVQAWKREHVLFEPARGCGISTRYHQYIDTLLGDLGLRARRKSNPILEAVSAYTAGDYAGLIEEYERVRVSSPRPRRPLALAT